MRVFIDIEGLIYYAQVHLMLDELDVPVARNQVLDLLHIGDDYIISAVDEDKIADMQSPKTLLKPILAYAIGAKIISKEESDEFCAKLMEPLSKRPSEIAYEFDIAASSSKDHDKGLQKANEWLQDYNTKKAYSIDQDKIKTVEPKQELVEETVVVELEDGTQEEQVVVKDDICKSVQKLVVYASVHLNLDELDITCVRNALLSELDITEYALYQVSEDDISGYTEPSALVEPIVEYALQKEIIVDSEYDSFASKIMGLLSKKASELALEFENATHSSSDFAKGISKATEWFYDYNKKNGYVSDVNIAKNKHWDAKGTRGKIEVVVNKTNKLENVSGEYPQCEYCSENQGYARTLKSNLRSLPIELGGEQWLWSYSQYSIIYHQILLANTQHQKHKVDRSTIKKMFDFNKALPHYFVACNIANDKQHEHFVGGQKIMPIFRAEVLQPLKSTVHPLIEIGQVDWYCNVFRLVGVDEKRLIDCTDDFVQTWYSLGKNNKVGLCVRKDKIGKYIVEISLQSGDHGASIVKQDKVNMLDILGVVSIDSNIDQDMEEIEQYVTKEIKFAADKLPDNLKKYKTSMEKLLKEVGTSKVGKLEAHLNVRDEINILCEDLLKGIKSFASASQKEEFSKKLGLMPNSRVIE